MPVAYESPLERFHTAANDTNARSNRRALNTRPQHMRTYAMSMQAPTGPTFLSLPMDDWDKPAGILPQRRAIGARLQSTQHILRELATALDGTQNKALKQRWPIKRSDSYYTFASAGIGCGLAAAMGISLAEHHSGRLRPVLAVIGDGSFQYAPQALWTAAQLELPIVVVVPRKASDRPRAGHDADQVPLRGR